MPGRELGWRFVGCCATAFPSSIESAIAMSGTEGRLVLPELHGMMFASKSSVNLLDVSRPPRLIEEWLRRTVDAQGYEEALVGNLLAGFGS